MIEFTDKEKESIKLWIECLENELKDSRKMMFYSLEMRFGYEQTIITRIDILKKLLRKTTSNPPGWGV